MTSLGRDDGGKAGEKRSKMNSWIYVLKNKWGQWGEKVIPLLKTQTLAGKNCFLPRLPVAVIF